MPKPPRPLLAILCLAFLLGIGFAWGTPLGGNPDETAHIRYVEVLATEYRLPALNLAERRAGHDDPDYESHQSPLYYVLAVPFWLTGRAIAGDVGAGQACRLLSLLIGAFGTWLIWRIAREVSPERPLLAVAATAFAAFLPMRVAISAAASNDPLAEATSSLALLLLIRGAVAGFDTRTVATAGVAVALALLSKQSAIVLLPTALLALFLGSRAAASGSEPGAWTRPFLLSGAVFAGALTLLSGWWFLRNHLIYGDPLGQRAFTWYFQDTPRWVDYRDAGWDFFRYLGSQVLPTTFTTFWGAFGHLDPQKPWLFMGWYPRDVAQSSTGEFLNSIQILFGRTEVYPPRSAVYPFLALMTWFAGLGLVRWWWRVRNEPEPPADAPPSQAGARVGVIALHTVFVAAVFLNFNTTYFQGQGRYLFPAIAALSLLFCTGWLEWFRMREAAATWVLGGLMLLLCAYALFGVVIPGFRSA